VKSVVVFDTRSGNTRRVAEAISAALAEFGAVRTLAVQDASATVWEHRDLLVVGGPTEGRHATPAVHALFDRLPAHALRGISAAAFDTRLDWPRLVSGSAAADIHRWLRNAGAQVVVPDGSFLVSSEPSLKEGELQRAADWAQTVARAVQEAASASPHPVAA
jgi:flavodoxin